MILVTQTIVYEGAVMIKPLNTLVTIVAVHSVFRPKILAINADVVEM